MKQFEINKACKEIDNCNPKSMKHDPNGLPVIVGVRNGLADTIFYKLPMELIDLDWSELYAVCVLYCRSNYQTIPTSKDAKAIITNEALI